MNIITYYIKKDLKEYSKATNIATFTKPLFCKTILILVLNKPYQYWHISLISSAPNYQAYIQSCLLKLQNNCALSHSLCIGKVMAVVSTGEILTSKVNTQKCMKTAEIKSAH